MRGLDIVFSLTMLVLMVLSVVVFFDIFEFIKGHELIFLGIFGFLAVVGSIAYFTRRKKQA